MESTFNQTVEEIEEIVQEIDQDIKDIGDVTDIQQPMPNPEQLEQLRKLLESLPREQSAKLLASLISGNNKMNPNNNSFSGVTEEEIRKHRFKQRLEQKKQARMTKGAQKVVQQKHITKMEKNKPKDDHVHDENCKH